MERKQKGSSLKPTGVCQHRWKHAYLQFLIGVIPWLIWLWSYGHTIRTTYWRKIVHAHTQRQLHIDAHTCTYCTSSPTTRQLYPRVHTEFMDLPAREERAQLPLIQGLHGQIVVSPKFPPHTPKLESAYRVKNMFFFKQTLLFFPGRYQMFLPSAGRTSKTPTLDGHMDLTETLG